ncbi:hypothetical protein KBC31_04415 [Candidatus Saccharibacteria bacterium]|jgi:hypothetical protein|nr:hypothetical protein [Candidatus Saccharibacteria bacterium]
MDENKNIEKEEYPQKQQYPYKIQPGYTEVPQQPTLKKSKLHNFVSFSCTVQTISIATILAVDLLIFLITLSSGSSTGSEFLGLQYLIPAAFGIFVSSLINLFIIPLYILRNKPQGKRLVYVCLYLLVSIIVFAVPLYGLFQSNNYTPPDYEKNYSESADERTVEDNDDKIEPKDEYSEISKENVVELLETCQVGEFFYTNQTNIYNHNRGELSSTGAVLVEQKDVPTRISIADRLIPELLPVAREAQKNCDELVIYRDNTQEKF